MQQKECKTTDVKGVHILQRDNREGQVNPRRITSTTIIGNKVKNNQGQEVGEIEEIVFDLTCGTIRYLVMSSGGLFGIGDRFLAVPMDAFTFDPEDKFFYLDIDKKALKKARGFDKNEWPNEPKWPLDGKRSEKSEAGSASQEMHTHPHPDVPPIEKTPEGRSILPGAEEESKAPIKARRP